MYDLDTIQETIIPILKNHKVKRASLFGSVVYGEQDKGSDIDLLVELPGGSSLFDLVRLKRDLEKGLNKKVDLVTYNSLHPLIKDKILREKQDVL